MLRFLLLVFGEIVPSQLIQDGYVFRHQGRKDIVASAKNIQEAADHMNTLEEAKNWQRPNPNDLSANLKKINSQLTDYQATDYKNQNGKIVVTYKQKDSQTSSGVQAYLHGISELTKITNKALKYFYDLVTSSLGQNRTLATVTSVQSKPQEDHRYKKRVGQAPMMEQRHTVTPVPIFKNDDEIFRDLNNRVNQYYHYNSDQELSMLSGNFENSPGLWAQLLEKFRSLQDVRKLIIMDSVKITTEQFSHLLDAVPNKPNWTELSLYGLAIDDEKADKLMTTLPQMTSLKNLFLNNNIISQEKMKALIGVIGQHLPNLEKLLLQSSVRDKVVQGPVRKELAGVLESILAKNPSDIVIANLNDQEVDLILAALEAYSGDRQSIDKNLTLTIKNAQLTNENWIQFSKAFQHFSKASKIKINLNDNNIQPDIIIKMKENFRANTNNRTILFAMTKEKKEKIINDYRIVDYSFGQSVRFFYHPNYVGEDLPFDDETWQIIAEQSKKLLTENKIKKFFAASQNPSPQQLKILLDKLPANLEQLELYNMGIDAEKADIIKDQVINKLTALTTLNLMGNSLNKQDRDNLRQDLTKDGRKLQIIF